MRTFQALLCAIVLSLSVVAPATAKDHPSGQLDMYSARVDAATAARLTKAGYDIADSAINADGTCHPDDRPVAPGTSHAAPRRRPDSACSRAKGKTSRERALEQAASGYDVYRSYDEPGGIRDELYDIAKKNAGFVKLEVLGHTIQGREIIALKVTQGAKGTPDGKRPAVLYMSNQHAREWISVEVNRRLLNWYIDQRKAENPEIVDLLKTTELWFIISANPDGYQFTFDHERLWRRNLRDNDGNGEITGADGVDPNRNYDEHWNYDNEGSSSSNSSDTYRGPAPRSEAETQAAAGLIDRVKPKFVVNFHSYGPLILYPQGWQVGTPDADNPIYAALAGTDANPGIAGFDPGLSSDELYVTNGETTDYAETSVGAISFTPELNEGCPNCGFVFPDDEALIQAEFEKTLAFDLDVAKSATHPGEPLVAPRDDGQAVLPLADRGRSPRTARSSMFDFRFDKSYGDPAGGPHPREAEPRRRHAEVPDQRRRRPERADHGMDRWRALRRRAHGTYYHVVGGTISGTSPDEQRQGLVRGRRPDERFVHLHGRLRDRQPGPDHGRRGLHRRVARPGARAALPELLPGRALGQRHRLRRLRRRCQRPDRARLPGRPQPLRRRRLVHGQRHRHPRAGLGRRERLSPWHCASCSRFATTSTRAASSCTPASTPGTSTRPDTAPSATTHSTTRVLVRRPISPRCRPLPGSGDNVNDVLEYWFGASLVNEDAGIDPDTGEPLDVVGVGRPVPRHRAGRSTAPTAPRTRTTTPRSSPRAGCCRWTTIRSSRAAPSPGTTGSADRSSRIAATHYVYSQIADISYKRLSNTIDRSRGRRVADVLDLVRHGGRLGPPLRRGPHRRPGRLDDPAGCERAHDASHRRELPGGLAGSPSLPRPLSDLERGRDLLADGFDRPVERRVRPLGGLAAMGDRPRRVRRRPDRDLDRLCQRLVRPGARRLHRRHRPADRRDRHRSSPGIGGWAIPGQPAGSAPNPNDFIVTTAGGFPEGAVIATDDTLYMGFGFEGITDAATREVVMGEAMDYLLP